MLKVEQNYDFRERLCKPHKRIYRIKGNLPKTDEIEIKNGDTLYIDECNLLMCYIILNDSKMLKHPHIF